MTALNWRKNNIEGKRKRYLCQFFTMTVLNDIYKQIHIVKYFDFYQSLLKEICNILLWIICYKTVCFIRIQLFELVIHLHLKIACSTAKVIFFHILFVLNCSFLTLHYYYRVSSEYLDTPPPPWSSSKTQDGETRYFLFNWHVY